MADVEFTGEASRAQVLLSHGIATQASAASLAPHHLDLLARRVMRSSWLTCDEMERSTLEVEAITR